MYLLNQKKRSETMTAALLCLLLTAVPVVTACGDAAKSPDNVSKNTDPVSAETEAVTEDPANRILDKIPEGTDFGGLEIRIRCNDFDQTQYEAELFVKGPDEADGDIVHDAILARNQKVEERLNVKFVYQVESYTYDQVYQPTQKLIMSGDDVYDLFVDQQYGLLKVAADNMLYNFKDNGINDFSQNYWWDEYMDQLQLGADARFIVAGDYFLDVVEVASAIFFNKAMYESHYEDSEELYQLAFDGKWTIEEFGKYIKEFYSDVNGDGKVDDGDLFSMNLSRNYMDAQVFGSGVQFMSRDKDGYPVLNMKDEKIANLMEIIKLNMFEPETTFNFATVSGVTEAQYYQNQRTSFANRQMLFLNDYLAAVKDLRDMKDDYGILPIPKMDESVDAYRSVSHDTAQVGAIPTTCQNADKVCTVLEALCSMSHNTTMQTYFEQAMKVKYARDEKSSEMIDLLHDSITSNFVYAFGPQMNNVYEIFRAMFDSKSSDYASRYAKMEKTVEKQLEKAITAYKEARGE